MKLDSKTGILFIAACFALIFPSEANPCPQSNNNRAKPAITLSQRSAKSKTTPDLTEWRLLLDNLAVESRKLDPEQERPLVIAEVADVYWTFDSRKSKELFILALDGALALTPTNQKADDAIQKIMALAAKRDRSLAMELAKRLLEHGANGSQSAGKTLRVARELVESDPKLAVELAKASSSLGPSMSGLWLVFKIAERDPAGAQQVYEAYLKNLIASQNLNLSSVLWLAGYPLGYGEAYGGSNDPTALAGFGGLRVPGLVPHPPLAKVYLDLAFASITETLRRAAAVPDPEKDLLNSLAFFAAGYLLSEVQRYWPSSQGSWSALYQHALGVTSSNRRIDVERRLNSIIEIRSRSNQSPEDFASGNAEDGLERIDKLPGGCRRDQAYAEIAFALSYSKKFNRALEIADRIENVALRGGVLQFINYDIASAEIEAGDLIRASGLADKVTAKDQRAVLYVRIGAKALKDADRSGALDVLNRARSLVRNPSEPSLEAGVLLAVAGVYSQFDQLEATRIIRDGIKALNRVTDPNHETFSVLRRVNLSCGDGDDRWYGGRERADTFSLYETLASIAMSDMQGEVALSLASEIDDGPTRVRAQLSVIRAVARAK